MAQVSFSCSISVDKDVYSSEKKEPVNLNFKLTNENSCDVYVLTWHTPLEGMMNNFLKVTRGGRSVPYRGIMAKRGPPSAESYILMTAGETVEASVSLSEAYSTESHGEYVVELSTDLMDVVPKEAGVEFLPNGFSDMTRVPIQCGPLQFQVQ